MVGRYYIYHWSCGNIDSSSSNNCIQPLDSHAQKILGVAALVGASQYPRDRVLWILLENGGKLERSRLRSKTTIRYSRLNPILDELVKEGRIRITGEIVTLVNKN